VKRLKQLMIILTLFLSLNLSMFAQEEEELDKIFLQETPEQDALTIENKKPKWEIYGFVESCNHFSWPGKGTISDSSVIKAEARGKMNIKFSMDHFYIKSSLDMYFYPRLDFPAAPHKSGSIEAQELYIGGGKKLRFKIGKQLFTWGSADMFPITNYFDQRDYREFIAVDREDKYEGVLALSLKYLFGNFALEVGVTPVHNPPLLPSKESFWSFIPGHPINAEPLAATLKNTSTAIRFGGTLGNLDFHASYFNGINYHLIFIPDWEVSPPGVKLHFDRIQTAGFDLSLVVDKLALRAEASYTSNMFAVNKFDITTPMETAPYCSYVIGFDYNLWGYNGILLVEWMQGKYLKNAKGYRDMLFTDMLLVRLEDKYFDERLKVELGAVFRLVKSPPGTAVNWNLAWDFRNGFSIDIGGYFFSGKEDDLFEYFYDKDMLYLKAKLRF
jgi:hypothetical protein